MIDLISGLKQQWLQVNISKLLGRDTNEKIQKENICLRR